MTIYDYLFDFFYNLFTSNDGYSSMTIKFGTDTVLTGVSMDLSEYFAYTLTWISLILIFIFLIKFCIWLFKLFGGLFKW